MKRWLLGLLLLVLLGLLLRWQLQTDGDAQVASPADLVPVAETAGAAPSTQKPTEPVVQEVVSESGIKLHLQRPVSLEKPDPPYGAPFAELTPLAQAGDRAAQFRLGLLLYECRDIPQDSAALDQQIQQMRRSRRFQGFEVDDTAQEERDQRRRAEECAGVPQDQRERYREWLKSAADAGLVEAQLGLMLHLPKGEYCQYIEQCSPQQREKMAALQAEAREYVGKARDAGSAQALWTFGAWYMGDEVLEPNDIQAYAHFRALDQVFVAAGEPRRFERMLASLKSKLRPVELEQAEARSRELLSNPNCCVLTR